MKKCCEKIPIEFHMKDYKLIFVFIFPICEILNTKIREQYLQTYFEFFLSFSTYLSFLFSSIFLIIIKVRTRKKQIGIKIDESSQSMTENDDKSHNIITIEYKKNVKIKSIKSLIYIVVLMS